MGASFAALVSPHCPTVLVVRDESRARQIRSDGIALEGALEARGHPDVVASIADLADIHPIDLVFIATKTTAIQAVCESLRPHLAELPFLISYQNGIESGRTIMQLLGTPRVLRMVLRYGAVLEDPDAKSGPLRVRVGLHKPPHFIGGEGESLSFARKLAPWIDSTGLPIRFTEDIEREAWLKGIENAAGNPVSALLRASLGELLEAPARGLVERLLEEGVAVARAAGLSIERGYIEKVLQVMAHGGTHLPSMAQDVLAGRATELTQLNEQIARRGRELGIATPAHDAIVDLIGTFDWRVARRA